MASCLEVLKNIGYDLRGYSPDTIVSLQEKEGDEEECLSYFVWLEVVYG